MGTFQRQHTTQPALFRANTLHNRLFSEPTHYTTGSFRASTLHNLTWSSISLMKHTTQLALFRANTLHNRLFSEPTHCTTGSFQSQHTAQPALFRAITKTRYVSRRFHRSYLKKNNKIRKSEGMRKVERTYHFWKYADAVNPKLSKVLVNSLFLNYSLPKLVRFLKQCHKFDAEHRNVWVTSKVTQGHWQGYHLWNL